jgi:polysaccharide chain length determinant protein (PEP-CTERM system associated)
MTRSTHEIARMILGAAWRRRYLVCVPAVVMPALAGIAHSVVPKAYEARMSVLVQEPGRLNPFLNDLSIGTNVKDRMPALIALVKSEHILGDVLKDIGQITDTTDPHTRDMLVGQLAGSLNVQLVGSEVVELKIRNQKATGLAKTLDAVGRRFIDRLVSPERGAVENSETFLFQQLSERRDALSTAEQAVANYKAQNADKLPALYATNVTRLASIQQRMEEKSMELATAEAVFNDLRTRLSSLNPVVGKLEESIVQLSSELASLRARYTDEHTEVRATERKLKRLQEERVNLLKEANAMKDVDMDRLWNIAAGTVVNGDQKSAPLLLSQMQRLQEAEGKRSTLRNEVEQLKKAIDEIRGSISTFAPIEQELQKLERAVTAAREMHDLLAKRYEMARLTGSLGRYESPERIKVIDSPQEPTSPVTPGRVIFVLAGLVGGIILGAGLAVAFEVLDPKLRRRDDVETASGLPVIAFIPKANSYVPT